MLTGVRCWVELWADGEARWTTPVWRSGDGRGVVARYGRSGAGAERWAIAVPRASHGTQLGQCVQTLLVSLVEVLVLPAGSPAPPPVGGSQLGWSASDGAGAETAPSIAIRCQL